LVLGGPFDHPRAQQITGATRGLTWHNRCSVDFTVAGSKRRIADSPKVCRPAKAFFAHLTSKRWFCDRLVTPVAQTGTTCRVIFSLRHYFWQD
jgi:hypothetical protein